MKLIDDWRRTLWKSWTVRLSALSFALQSVFLAWPTAMLDIWTALPAELKGFLPYHVAMFIPLALTLAAIVARPIVQKSISGGGDGGE